MSLFGFVASMLLTSLVLADDNGAQLAMDTHRFRFSREFVANDMFEGARCALSGEPMRQYDPKSPGQLFQSCWGGVIAANANAGGVQLTLDSISSAAIAPLGNDAELTQRYNMSKVTQFTSFASIRIDPETEMDLQIAAADLAGTGKVTFQSMADAQLQPLLNVTRGQSLNASALAALPLADGPNFFLARFADANSAAPPSSNLTGAALRKELLGNSIALLKLYVVVSPRATPIVHWEVLGATSKMIQYTEDAAREHHGGFFNGGLLGVDTSVAAAGVAVAVIALLLSLALCCVVWRMRRTTSYSTVK